MRTTSTSARLVAGLLLAAVAVTGCGGGDGKSKAGAKNSASSGGKGGAPEAPSAPRPESTEMVRAWSYDTAGEKDPQGEVHGTWADASGRRYVGSKGGLFVLDSATGTATPAPPMNQTPLCGMTPELAGNVGVVALLNDKDQCADASAIDVSTGKTLWTTRYTSTSTSTKTPYFSDTSKIVVAGNVVVASSHTMLAGYDLASGQLLWQVLGTKEKQDWTVDGLLADADRVLVTRSTLKSASAELIDVRTGKVLGDIGFMGNYDDTAYPLSLNPPAVTLETKKKSLSDPVLKNIVTFKTDKPGLEPDLTIPFEQDGTTLGVDFQSWGGFDRSRNTTSALVDNGVVYTMARIGKGDDTAWGVAAMDLKTGRLRWTQKAPEVPAASSSPAPGAGSSAKEKSVPYPYEIRDGFVYTFTTSQYRDFKPGSEYVQKYSLTDGAVTVSRTVHDVEFDGGEGVVRTTPTGFVWLNLKAHFVGLGKKSAPVIIAFNDK